AQPNVNLGCIFLQKNECLKKIKSTLITSGETFKPPLIQFNNQKIQAIIESFDVKDEIGLNSKLSSFSLNFSEKISISLKKVLKDFTYTIPDLNYAFVTIEGGFLISNILKKKSFEHINLDNISAMSYSLLQTANRCAWLLKKMSAENILLDCEHSFQFINRLDNSIFSAEITKSRQKLGLLRLILPQFSRKINDLVKDASKIRDYKEFDVKKLLGQLVIK
ncbi:MAG: hypothetical protein ACFFAT_20155, partial [Promethearchaeota archaeon]